MTIFRERVTSETIQTLGIISHLKRPLKLTKIWLWNTEIWTLPLSAVMSHLIGHRIRYLNNQPRGMQ